MVYALLVERLYEQIATERQVAAVLIAAGNSKVQMPDYMQAHATFDAALFAEPAQVDAERDELLRALGVR